MAQTPKLPKDWKRWVDKVGIGENYIFYQYSRKGAKTGYCTFCEKEVAVSKPRHNKTGRCMRCRHKITYKSIGRAGTVVTEDAKMYLMPQAFSIRRTTSMACWGEENRSGILILRPLFMMTSISL